MARWFPAHRSDQRYGPGGSDGIGAAEGKRRKNEKTPEHDGHDGLDIGMSSII